jgi:hypothetical protein
MADNLKGIPFSNEDEGKPFPEVAKDIVRTVTDGEIYVVWFAYVLGAWKAVCSTDIPDGRYYEVTYHAGRKVAFLDTYVKVENREVEIS